ncbi:putative oxidoreductase [Lachnellula willkommii]|uniref:Putative oxidoreductase n=1 Tax=Lachnellula willkommii TaxID=215461 RepID=A0A559MFH6_9HELO|nr:putative oxidoreductase [Lachnellula willkommii]
MGKMWSQLVPPTPQFTEKDLPDQTGKVFIVTGSSSGVGQELAQILYAHNAKVYIAARSAEKSTRAIESIKTNFPNSKGQLVYLHLDLDDLTTIKASAEEFLSKEEKLDVLWNNAGVMVPPPGSETKQGYELQLGTNNLAPFLFTKLLTPILIKTAKSAPTGTVRVVWVSSSAAENFSPRGGVEINNLDYKRDQRPSTKYGISKAGNIFQATEYAKNHGNEGIISVALNPGNLKSELARHTSSFIQFILNLITYTAIHGAYTELFAGLSPEVTPARNGAWIQPWGRFAELRQDVVDSIKSEAEGGTGVAARFWEWNEEQVKAYL